MKSKVGFWLGAVFLAVGLCIIGASGLTWKAQRDIFDNGIRTKAQVIDLQYIRDDEGDGSWAPIFAFRDQQGKNHIYRPNSSSNPPAYSRNEIVDIVYLPDQPERAVVDDFTGRWLLPTFLLCFGGLFAAMGGTVMAIDRSSRRAENRMRDEGTLVMAEVTGCHPDSSLNVNGRTPWRVSAQAKDETSGKYKSYLSPPIWIDLSKPLKGKSVRVMVDPSGADDYWMDLTDYIEEDEFA